MSQVHVFSSAAFNYIPKVRMLFRSVREHHPEFRLCLALSDCRHEEFDLSAEPMDELLPLADLGIPEWKGWAFCHDIVELSTAIKPFALLNLLSRPECSKVIYLDPDIVMFSRVDDILEAMDDASLVLTPHQTEPEVAVAAVIDNEICSLKHGIYNLGFLGVRATDEGMRFAEWWGTRVYHFCRADIPNGLFTDQRWIDFVPAFFEGVGIIRSSRHNVATWNLTTREMTGSLEAGIKVDGQSLGFYHFTGFDSGAHRQMASKNAEGNRSVGELIEWYGRQTADAGRDPLAQVPWAYGQFANGEPISKAQRLVFRNRIDLQRDFPDPFNSQGPRSYYDWWENRAPIEYPGLFEAQGESEILASLSKGVSPVFRRASAGTRWSLDG